MEQTLFVFNCGKQGCDTEITFLLAWSDDCDMAGTSDPHMQYIEDACKARWKIKQVNPSYMLGVRRTLTKYDSVWVLKLTQEDFIDGVVGAYQAFLEADGWNRKSPETPTPKGEHLSLTDEISDTEAKTVMKRGYKALCGSLLWPSRFTHKEISQGISQCCRVMSRPSEKAWKHAIQMLAWLRDHRLVGMTFSSDNDSHGLVCMSDASNKPDPKDSRCQHCHVVQWMGGTISMVSSKLPHASYGTPGNEYCALRWAAAKVRRIRNLIEEIGLESVISEPTKVYCDSNTAISWHKTGKISDGNQYLDLAYHQPREWEMDGSIKVLGIDTKDNVSDIGSKPFGPEEVKLFVGVLRGQRKWTIKFPRETISFT